MLCKSSLGPDPVHMHTVMQVDGGYHAHVTERKACWLGDMCHCMCTPWNKMWTCEQCMNINDPHTLLGLLSADTPAFPYIWTTVPWPIEPSAPGIYNQSALFILSYQQPVTYTFIIDLSVFMYDSAYLLL